MKHRAIKGEAMAPIMVIAAAAIALLLLMLEA